MNVEHELKQFQAGIQRIREELGKVIVGQERVVEHVLIALFGKGHVLLEGVPGLGKTMLVRCLGKVLDLNFSRVQFTPDLMPADVTGTNIVNEDDQGHKRFEFQPGPLFAHLVLADEINRATPKTQSSLLEAMQESSVPVAGVTHHFDPPFFVLATQNPIEMEGTYPLPEAQVDRFFFKLLVTSPSLKELSLIVDRTTGAASPELHPVMKKEEILKWQSLVRETPVPSHVKEFVIRCVDATHPNSAEATPMTKQYVRYGVSPRGAQSLILAAKIHAAMDGRYNVGFDDVQAVAAAALRHRILLNFEGTAEGVSTDRIVETILGSLPKIQEPVAS